MHNYNNCSRNSSTSTRNLKTGEEGIDVADLSKRHGWYKKKFICDWNLTCKALFLGLMLMLIGASMAIVGYFVEHISGDANRNDKEKIRFTINSISTYVGPMIMGAGGFIVVAACVMTFEQRDSVGKVPPSRLQLNTTHMRSVRHSNHSPVTRQPLGSREGSGRRHNAYTNKSPTGQPDQTSIFSRRDLTADFIQFSRNLQQAKIEKSFSERSMSRCPSAPNLAVSPEIFPIPAKYSPQNYKRTRNSLHPFGGSPVIGTPMLHRQALSVDYPDSGTRFASPPCSKHPSRQGSTSTAGKGSAESLSLFNKGHGQHGQMELFQTIHPLRMLMRDRRSDTARRHLFVRQAQIESDEDSYEHKDAKSESPQLNNAHQFFREYQSNSTPHSRRESYYSNRSPSSDDPWNNQRRRGGSSTGRNISPTGGRRGRYSRSNTFSNETNFRRSSQHSSTELRKNSADYNRKNRRKSLQASDSSRHCSNETSPRRRYTVRSPTTSLRSMQDNMQLLTEKLEQTGLRQMPLERNNSMASSHSRSPRRLDTNSQSISPDSLSVSSCTMDCPLQKTGFLSVETTTSEEDAESRPTNGNC